jgi:hypothetical protein
VKIVHPSVNMTFRHDGPSGTSNKYRMMEAETDQRIDTDR